MKLTVQHIPTNYCAQAWPLVEGFIAQAHQHDPSDYSMEQIQMYVTMGMWVLLVAVDENSKVHGAGTVSFINYPTNRVAFFTTIGGKLISNQDTFEQLKALLKAMGATKIQGAVRESVERWLKRYGFAKRYSVVQSDI
jgi:hypothetical protein